MTATKTPEASFAEALAAFQADVPHIGKGQTANTASYSYSYADLTDITLLSLPLLAAHGFSWTAKTTVTDNGFVLLSSLMHSAGHKETCEWPLPDPTRSTAQQVGSALTYGRRYTFTALTGVAPGGEDDDAQAANSRAAADVRVDPTVAAKNAVWEQAQRLGWDLDALKDRYAQDHDGTTLESATASDLREYAQQLSREGANGLPLNKDGSVSRSKTTEEERTDAGMMSKEERKEHDVLVDEVTSTEGEVERLTPGAADEDPWANVPVAVPGGAE